jgi:glycosyltransferase involved in cell wall biosynthesis
MELTVAICTRNRASSIQKTLHSLTKLDIPPDTMWELLIIDNGSTDNTAVMVDGFKDRLPVRRIHEPKAGLSNARNRAVEAACGSYLLWTDDDVLLEPGWLAAYAEAFRAHPEAAVFGGKILPVLAPPTPKWFTEALSLLGSPLAFRDLGEAPIRLSAPERLIPYGANYAIRMQEQRTLRYDANLGASPDHNRLGEEVEVINTILQSGGTGFWVPGAVVHHCIPASRQTVGYVFRYYKSQGETVAFTEPDYDCPKWFSVPRWLWLRMPRRLLRYYRDRLTAPPERWIQSLIDYAYDRGAFDHWRHLGQTRRP